MAKRPPIPEIEKKTVEEFPTKIIGTAGLGSNEAAAIDHLKKPPNNPSPETRWKPDVENPSEIAHPTAQRARPHNTLNSGESEKAADESLELKLQPDSGRVPWRLVALVSTGAVLGWLVASAMGPSESSRHLIAAEAVEAERAESRVALAKAAEEVTRANTERNSLRDARARTDYAVAQALDLLKASDAGRPLREMARRLANEANNDRKLHVALAQLVSFDQPAATREALLSSFEAQTAQLTLTVEPSESIASMVRLWAFAISPFYSSEQNTHKGRNDALVTARKAVLDGDLGKAVEALRDLDRLAQSKMQPWIDAAQARILQDSVVELASTILVIRATRRFVD